MQATEFEDDVEVAAHRILLFFEFGGQFERRLGRKLGDGVRGLGGGVGGDASDVEEGGGGAACDFGFFGSVGEVNELGNGMGRVLRGEETDLDRDELDLETKHVGGVMVLEDIGDIVSGTFEILEKGVEVDDVGFEILEKLLGGDGGWAVGLEETEGIGWHGSSFR